MAILKKLYQNQIISAMSRTVIEQQKSNQNNSFISCQICGKQANYSCYNCQKTNYCSKQHQLQHWNSVHKNQCNKKQNANSQRIAEIQKQIIEARKNFYENYSNKIFNQCLLDTKLMTGLSNDLRRLKPNKIIFQLEYGASVCLMVRTYKLLNDNANARSEMLNYLAGNKQFLYDFSKYKLVRNDNKVINEQLKEQFQSKLNLIAGIANLCYVIGMNTTEYYVLYTRHIITCFGEDSYQASNCYFLLGTFFAEEGFFNKAIACFQKAANIRGQFSGDCMFNIGLLHKLMNNSSKALQTLQIAIKLRQQQYGEDSNQVSQVNQLMGIIYTDQNDFTTALSEYKKAFDVRCANPISPEYYNILELIHDLYNKLCLYIRLGQPNMKRPQIYAHLKQQIQGQSAYWQNEKYRKNKTGEEQPGQGKSLVDREKYKKKKIIQLQEELKFSWKDSKLFNITEQFIQTLNLSELFRLSQLQLQLSNCDSIFNLAYIVGTSLFFQLLRPQKKAELQKENQRLFELMSMEDVKRIKHKNK